MKRNIFKYTFFQISKSCNLLLPLVNYNMFALFLILISFYFKAIFCFIFKNFTK